MAERHLHAVSEIEDWPQECWRCHKPLEVSYPDEPICDECWYALT